MSDLDLRAAAAAAAMKDRTVFRVAEISRGFHGEGPVIGMPCVFVTFGGCDSRCSWCNSPHAVDPAFEPAWDGMTTADILREVDRLLSPATASTITLSGGNPALWDLTSLIRAGHQLGHAFVCETQGTIACDWFAELDGLVLSPKPPSSGVVFDNRRLSRCIASARGKPDVALKVVVGDLEDYRFAVSLHEFYPDIDLYLQPLNTDPDGAAETTAEDKLDSLRALQNRVLGDRLMTVKVLPQLQSLLDGPPLSPPRR